MFDMQAKTARIEVDRGTEYLAAFDNSGAITSRIHTYVRGVRISWALGDE